MTTIVVTGIGKKISEHVKKAAEEVALKGNSVKYYDMSEVTLQAYEQYVHPLSKIKPETIDRLFMNYLEMMRALGYATVRNELLEMKLEGKEPDYTIIRAEATLWTNTVYHQFKDDRSLKEFYPDAFFTLTRNPERLLNEFMYDIGNRMPTDKKVIIQTKWRESKKTDLEYVQELLEEQDGWQQREVIRTKKWADRCGNVPHEVKIIDSKSRPITLAYAIQNIGDKR